MGNINDPFARIKSAVPDPVLLKTLNDQEARVPRSLQNGFAIPTPQYWTPEEVYYALIYLQER